MIYPNKIDRNPLYAANTDAQANTIYGVWSDRNGNVYAAAESGTILHHTIADGKTQVIDVGDSSVDFYDIFGIANKFIIAVGTHGIMYRYNFDDHGWQRFSPPGYQGEHSQYWLESVWARNENDIAFVGDDGIIWHYDGKTAQNIRIFGSYQNRFYSVAGVPGQDKFIAVGSYGTIVEFKRVNGVLKVKAVYAGYPGEETIGYQGIGGDEEKAYKVYTGISNDFYGIELIPKTETFLLCGKDGGIFVFDNGRIKTLSEFSFQPMLTKIFGVDIIPKGNKYEVVMVGWEGYSLHYDGEKWKEYALGANSYMEGVVYAGQNLAGKNVWVGGGFHGRIMSFTDNAPTSDWRINQSGRCEFINCTAISGNAFVGGADTGRAIAGVDYKTKEIYSAGAPHNYNVALPMANPQEFLLAGGYGKIEIVNAITGTIRPYPKTWTGTEDILCMTQDATGAYLAGSTNSSRKPVFLRYNIADDTLAPAEDMKKSKYTKNIYSLTHSDGKFYVLNSSNTIETLDPSGAVLPMQIPLEFKPDILFGNYGHTFFSYKTALYKITNGVPEIYLESFNYFFVAGEYASYATVSNQEAEIHIAGSKGSILIILSDKTIHRYHSGAYNKIHSVSINGNTFVAGLKKGRIVTGALNGSVRYFSGISAPTYPVVCKHTAGFCYAGESGVIGIFSDAQRQSQWRTYNLLGDVLCGDDHAGGTVLAGCGFIAFVPAHARFSRDIIYFTFDPADHKIVTSIIVHHGQCYMGTTQGEIYRFPIQHLQEDRLSASDFIQVAKNLEHVVINIDVKLNRTDLLQATLENGKVVDVTSAGTLERYHFNLQSLTHPSACNRNKQDGFWIAGSNSFLAHVDGLKISIYTLPWTIYTISLHGAIRETNGYTANEYWVAGSSGTLFVYLEGTWYQIESGTGNHLYAGAANQQLVLIAGEYGALRWQTRSYIDAHIPSTKLLPAWQSTQKERLPHEGLSPNSLTESAPASKISAAMLFKARGFILT